MTEIAVGHGAQNILFVGGGMNGAIFTASVSPALFSCLRNLGSQVMVLNGDVAGMSRPDDASALGGAALDIVHVAHARALGVIPEFRRAFPSAKIFFSVDEPRDEIIAENLARADAIVVPHKSITDALQRAGKGGVAGLLRAFDGGGRLFAVQPGIDTAVFNPMADPHLQSFARYSLRPPENGPYPNTIGTPCSKCSNRLHLSYLFHMNGSRFKHTMLYGPNLSVEGNWESARQYLEWLLDDQYLQIFLTGDWAEAPGHIVELMERHAFHHEGSITRRVGYVSDSDERMLHLLLAGAVMAVFPPEANSFGFVGTAYALRLMRAMRYGAMAVVDESFLRQGLVTPFDSDKATGTAFIFDGGDGSGNSLTSAINSAEYEAHIANVGHYQYSKLIPNAMNVDFSLDTYARRLENIYRIVLGRGHK